MKSLVLGVCGLAIFLGLDSIQASQKLKSPSIEQLDLQDVTLEQALDQIMGISRKDDPTGVGLNISLIKDDLAPIQIDSRFSLQAKDVLYSDLLYAISKRLGLGYRIERHAIVIASGNKIGLPPPKTEGAVALSKKIKLDLELPGDVGDQ